VAIFPSSHVEPQCSSFVGSRPTLLGANAPNGAEVEFDFPFGCVGWLCWFFCQFGARLKLGIWRQSAIIAQKVWGSGSISK